MNTKNADLYAAQKRYIERNNAERGLTRVNLWVPNDNVEEIKDIAREMRVEMKQPNPS